MAAATCSMECNGRMATLFVALELGSTRWQLAFAVTHAGSPRVRTIPAGNLAHLQEEIAAAKARFALPADAPPRA